MSSDYELEYDDKPARVFPHHLYPEYLLFMIAYNTKAPRYFFRYATKADTEAACERALADGYSAEVLKYLGISLEDTTDNGIYEGRYRNYRVPHDQIIDRRE